MPIDFDTTSEYTFTADGELRYLEEDVDQESHSGLSAGEGDDEWERIEQNQDLSEIY